MKKTGTPALASGNTTRRNHAHIAKIALHLGLVTLTAPMMVQANEVVAPTTEGTAQVNSRNCSIVKQPLYSALSALAEQAGIQFVYSAEMVKNLISPGVQGKYTADAALQQVLSGTDISFRHTGSNTVALEHKPEQIVNTPTLKAMTVTGKATYDAKDPYNPDYVQPDATTGTKTDTPVMETPLNVQVITKQVLKDQQVIRLDQALKNVSGVTTSNNSLFGNTVVLRGFPTQSLFRNGVRFDQSSITSFGNGSQQMANVESIEVLKGPAAILYGRVEPGGMVNIITKKPLATPYYSLNQQFGSYDLYRTSIDATGPLTKDDTLLYRMNASYQSNGSYRDLVDNENVFLAPVLTWNISPRTQATVEMEYQHNNGSQDQQVLPFVDAGTPSQHLVDLPHSRNLGERNPLETENIFAGFNWSHQFNDDWSIKHQFAFKRHDDNLKNNALPVSIRLDDRQVDRFIARAQLTDDTYTTVLDLTGHFNTWGLKHTLLFGGDYYRFDNYVDQSFGNDLSSISLDRPDHPGPDVVIDPSTLSINTINTDNYGLYLQDQIKLPYNIQVMGGLRYQYIHQKNASAGADRVYTTNAVQTVDAVTPRVGLLWQPKNWLSLYSNYAENFGANTFGAIAFGGIDAAGDPLPGKSLPPTSAQQWEVGAKTEFFDGRLRATLAYYDLTKQNVATTDTAHPAPFCGFGCSIAVGEVRSKGPELDIQGEILPGWNLIATYANQDVRVTKSTGDVNGTGIEVGNRLQFVPRNIGSVWSTYEVQQGQLDGFKIGGGVNLQDSMVNADNTLKSPGYALVGLMTGYSFKVGKSRLTAQLNIENLLDKNYFTNAAPAFDGSLAFVNFSTPRTFIGSINIAY